MQSLSFINWITHLADIMLLLYLGQNYWDWTDKGKNLKELLESGVTRWVQTRADTAISKEVVALQRFFAKSFLVLGSIWLMLQFLPLHNLPAVQQIERSLNIISLLIIIGFVSLDWTFQHRSLIYLGVSLLFSFSLYGWCVLECWCVLEWLQPRR